MNFDPAFLTAALALVFAAAMLAWALMERARANRMEGVRIALAVSRWSASSSESRPTSSAGSAW